MFAVFWWGNPKARERFEDLAVGRRVILKWIFKNKNGMMWTGSGCEQVAGFFEHGNESLGSLK